MKKVRQIIWDNEAKRSLESIFEYIKFRESERVAKKVRNEIIRQARNLNRFPSKFAPEPHLKNIEGDFRYKVVWSYKIIYEITPENILVLDIFHTSRDPSNIKRRA